MKARWIALALVAAAAASGAAEPFDIAITVDDLPAHGPLPPGMTRAGIASAYLATLKAHRVPEAFGFVNAAKLPQDPDGAKVLDLWRQAGHPLGNHTYSHLNLQRAASLEAWQADVIAGEPEVAGRMRGAMKRQYVHEVERGIVQMKEHSTRVYGRVIPQVLLTHLGGWSAVTLPEVMARLDAAGARYVTLAQAQSDPAYAEPGGGSVIARTAKRKGIALQADPAPGPDQAPALDLKALCR